MSRYLKESYAKYITEQARHNSFRTNEYDLQEQAGHDHPLMRAFAPHLKDYKLHHPKDVGLGPNTIGITHKNDPDGGDYGMMTVSKHGGKLHVSDAGSMGEDVISSYRHSGRGVKHAANMVKDELNASSSGA